MKLILKTLILIALVFSAWLVYNKYFREEDSIHLSQENCDVFSEMAVRAYAKKKMGTPKHELLDEVGSSLRANIFLNQHILDFAKEQVAWVASLDNKYSDIHVYRKVNATCETRFMSN